MFPTADTDRTGRSPLWAEISYFLSLFVLIGAVSGAGAACSTAPTGTDVDAVESADLDPDDLELPDDACSQDHLPAVVLVCGGRITGVAVDATTLYWADWGESALDGRIMAMALEDPMQRCLAEDQEEPVGIALGSESVYWTNPYGGRVLKISKAGGEAVILASGEDRPYGIAVRENHLVFGNFLGNGIRHIDGDSGEVSDWFLTGEGPGELALDGETLFWTEPNAGRVVTGALSRPGEFVVIAADQQTPDGIDVDTERVYWTEFEAGRVISATHEGGDLTVLASDLNHPTVLRADQTHLYWITPQGLWSMPKEGGQSPEIMVALSRLHSIWLTEEHIYVSRLAAYDQPADGMILRIEKSSY